MSRQDLTIVGAHRALAIHDFSTPDSRRARLVVRELRKSESGLDNVLEEQVKGMAEMCLFYKALY